MRFTPMNMRSETHCIGVVYLLTFGKKRFIIQIKPVDRIHYFIYKFLVG